MGENLLWLLFATALCLLVGWHILRRRADARRLDAQDKLDAVARTQAQRQAERHAEEQRLAAEHAAAERIAAERRREAGEQAERERSAALDAAHAAQRLATEQVAHEAEARRQAERHAEEGRLAAERAEAGRIAAARRREAAELAERERVAALEAELEARRQAAAQAAREAQAQAEAQALHRSARRAEQERAEQARAEQARAEAERAAAAVPRRAIVTAAQTLVLVADDSKVVRIKTGRLLAQHQYQVAYASDGLDAVQQIQARTPDVLITDVEMPGMDGFELTRQLRADPQTAQLPVIMITAADDRHREQADAAGVSVLLGKPYPEDALIAHIRQALGQEVAPAQSAGSSRQGALDVLA